MADFSDLLKSESLSENIMGAFTSKLENSFV